MFLYQALISLPDDALFEAWLTCSKLDWEPRPTAPVSIRLISMGRVLEDNAKLSGTLFTFNSLNYDLHFNRMQI